MFKKGGKNEYSNYCGITLLRSVGSIYDEVMKCRIEREFLTNDEQSDDKVDRSGTENTFTIWHVSDKRLAQNLETHIVFIDLCKIYESIFRVKL